MVCIIPIEIPEIVVNNINHDNIFLWKNTSTSSNNWLKVKLEGTQSNRDAVGSLIEISVNGQKQYRYTLCVRAIYLKTLRVNFLVLVMQLR